MNLRLFWLCVSLAGLASSPGADWAQWRGPQRNGISSERVNPGWPAGGPPELWRAAVGTGFSSVAISQGRAYTMGNTTNQDTVWCFDARSGKELWRHSYASKLSPQWYEGGPGATPTVEGADVFTISKWGDVFRLDAADGTVRWYHDLRQDGVKPNRWGFAGSPLLWRDLVILNAGDAGIALARSDGRVVWSTGTNAAGYASPTLCRFGGRECVLIFAAKHLVALDPETGREWWRHPWRTEWDTNNSDPLVDGDSVFVSSFSHGCSLLSVKGAGPEVVYENKVLFNHLSPPVLLGDHLYAFNGEAKKTNDFRCVHLPTGQLKWSRTDPAFGSLIAAENAVIVLADKGELLLFDRAGLCADGSGGVCAPLARARVLSGTCWTPPSLANGLLYVRNAKGDLRCLDLRPQTTSR